MIAGVLIMGLVQNAMNLLNIPPFYQYVARGCILLGAVTFYFADAESFWSHKRGLLRIVADEMAATAEKAQLIDELRR